MKYTTTTLQIGNDWDQLSFRSISHPTLWKGYCCYVIGLLELGIVVSLWLNICVRFVLFFNRGLKDKAQLLLTTAFKVKTRHPDFWPIFDIANLTEKKHANGEWHVHQNAPLIIQHATISNPRVCHVYQSCYYKVSSTPFMFLYRYTI